MSVKDSTVKQLDLVQGSAEWHRWRRGGVGASDVAALFDVSPYKTKRDLWFEKMGLGEPDDEDRSFIYARGHETEEELRELFSEYIGTTIKPTCFQRGIIYRASLDGYEKPVGVFEAKYVGKAVLKKAAEKGEIPEHHRIQVQTQLLSSESDKGYWGARAPKVKERVVVEIGRDEKLIAQIEEEVEKFWELVEKNIAPPLSAKDTLFITDLDQAKLFERLDFLKREKDAIEAKYKEIEAEIKKTAQHPKVRYGNITVTEVERRGSIDYLKIPEVKQLDPEYLEGFRKKTSIYKQIRFGKDA